MSSTVATVPAEVPTPATPAPAQVAVEEPRISDTYSLMYAFTLLFLFPGSLLVGQLPFRTYTFQYVSLVTMPFVLGFVLTLLTDSTDTARRTWLRIAVLTPLVMMSGVAVLFTSTLFLPVVAPFLGPEFRAQTTPIAALLLVAIGSPLIVAVWRRLRTRITARSAFQVLALVSAIVLVIAVAVVSVTEVGRLGQLAHVMRKDVVIYIIGGLMWYLPAFGLAAGVWRRVGLV